MLLLITNIGNLYVYIHIIIYNYVYIIEIINNHCDYLQWEYLYYKQWYLMVDIVKWEWDDNHYY